MSTIWLGFDTESDVTRWSAQPGLHIPPPVLDEALAAAARLVEILARHQTRATFFLVGRLLEAAGSEYRTLLAGHDVQCHTYSHHIIHAGHPGLYPGHPVYDLPPEAERSVRRGIELIEHWFGYRPEGLCAPGGSPNGLRGQPEVLRILWTNGIRFVKSDNLGTPETPMLPSRIHPYTYAEEGYPELWELPGVGWHCTLTLPRDPVGDWPPRSVIPDGPLVDHPPQTPAEHIAWVKQELDYVRAQGYQFSPSWHPWSLYRFDPQMEVVDALLEYAEKTGMPVSTYREVWRELIRGQSGATVYTRMRLRMARAFPLSTRLTTPSVSIAPRTLPNCCAWLRKWTSDPQTTFSAPAPSTRRSSRPRRAVLSVVSR